MTSDLHAMARERLRRTRQRYTVGRRDLVVLLRDAGRPLTIPELVEAGAEQSQSSLYRNLAILEQCCVVRRVASVDDVSRYELDEALTEHHHHLICQTCGRIDDIMLPAALEHAIDSAVAQVGAEHAYRVDDHRLELLGTCAECT